MAIRIRVVNGEAVALCAAKTEAEKGDIYLDDFTHHALTTKFGLDFESEGFMKDPPVDEILVALTREIES